MAYDEVLANRIRHALAGDSALTEKKMFGGLAFLHRSLMLLRSASGPRLHGRLSSNVRRREKRKHRPPKRCSPVTCGILALVGCACRGAE